MRKVFAQLLLGLIALTFVSEASAHPHRQRVVIEQESPIGFFFGHVFEHAARTPGGNVLSVARRYVGSGKFTPYRGPWCADGLNVWLRKAGYPANPSRAARDFRHYGVPTYAHPGAIAVMPHHVGVVAGVEGNKIYLLSANHLHRVGYGWYSKRRIIAYREP
jgi:hypothetical protein